MNLWEGVAVAALACVATALLLLVTGPPARSGPSAARGRGGAHARPLSLRPLRSRRAHGPAPAVVTSPAAGAEAPALDSPGVAGAPTPLSRRAELARAARLFRDYHGGRRLYLVALGLLVAEAATAVLTPWPIAYLIDYLQGARPDLRDAGWPSLLADPRTETVAVLTLAVLLLAMVNSAADSLAEICFARGGRVLGYHVRVALYSHLQRLSLALHDRLRTGDVLTRVTGDVTALEEFVTKSVSNLAGSLLVLAGTLGFLFWQSWQVALVALLVVPVLALVSNHYSRLIKVATKRQRAREGDLASGAQEMLTSIRVVQSYGHGGYDLQRFAEQSDASRRAAVEAAGVEARFSWVVSVLEALTIGTVVWIGLFLLDRRALTVGTLVLFILLIQNMFKPTRKIIKEWYQIGKVYASAERIADLLERRPAVVDAPDAVPVRRAAGHLTFDDVTFTYQLDPGDAAVFGDRSRRGPALSRVSFDVAPGEVLGLVGFSGAGKSTVAQLVPRLYDPQEGSVLLDGVDIRRYTLESLRAQVSVVLQETVLFRGTVADNIAYGRAGATREEVLEAALLANVHEFVDQLADGFDTMLDERAANLSGGQRQRIAIARAIVRNTPVLILDEPTTGLDGDSTQLVLRALRTLMQGKTTLIISHDLNLVRSADRVVVLERGQVVQSGRPQELVAAGGAYAALFPGQRAAAPDGARRRRPPPVRGGQRPDRRVQRQHAGGVSAVRAARGPEAGAPHPVRTPLRESLIARLPGLPQALDAHEVAAALVDTASGHVVESSTAGSLHVHDDGTCGVRYDLRVRSSATGPQQRRCSSSGGCSRTRRWPARTSSGGSCRW